MHAPIRSLAAVAVAALTLSACEKVSDAAFEQKVRAYLLEHPEVIEQAIHKLNETRQAEAIGAVAENLEKHRAALERDPRDFVANPKGDITVVEFFDYRCGYCKSAAPEMLKLIAENPDVRFVFKEWPIFGEESKVAAEVMLTPAAKPRTLELHKALMAEKSLDDDAIDRILTSAGVDPAAARKAGAAADIQRQLADGHELATSLGLEGTPAFIIGKKVIPGADIQAVQLAISEARAARAEKS
jgi:protein-disulfide isomerase